MPRYPGVCSLTSVTPVTAQTQPLGREAWDTRGIPVGSDGHRQSRCSGSGVVDGEHHGGFLWEKPAPIPGTHCSTKGTSRS